MPVKVSRTAYQALKAQLEPLAGKGKFAKKRGKPKGPKPLEKDIQRAMRDRLVVMGAKVIRMNSGAVKMDGRFIRFNDSPGCSDLIVCLQGRYVSVEVKRPGNKPTRDQLAFMKEVRLSGGVALCVCSVEAMIAALAAEGFRV